MNTLTEAVCIAGAATAIMRFPFDAYLAYRAHRLVSRKEARRTGNYNDSMSFAFTKLPKDLSIEPDTEVIFDLRVRKGAR